MTRAFVRPGVVAQAVVDHSSKSGLARPNDRVKPAIGELLTHHGDVGIGVERAVSLVEDREVGQATNDRMSVGAHDNAEQILFRVHGAIPHPVAAEHRGPRGHGGHRCGADVHSEQCTASLKMRSSPRSAAWMRDWGRASRGFPMLTTIRSGSPGSAKACSTAPLTVT